jgi:membrane protease YdiL (CAAX protease family)
METTPALEPSPQPSIAWWAVADLVAFGAFFLFTLVFLPAVLVIIARVFIPGLNVANLSGEAQILLQAVLDIAWVGFLFFLVKVVHRKPILEAFRWHRSHQYRVVTLIAIGVALAIAVFAVSSLFPPSSPPAIEKLAESSRSLYMLVIFGIVFAPLIEEIIFRGFIFNALSELGGARIAVPATAVLFALLHAPQLWPSLAGVVLIFVVGCVLSVVRERSNSLIPSFIVHTTYNGMLVGASAIATLLEKGK